MNLAVAPFDIRRAIRQASGETERDTLPTNASIKDHSVVTRDESENIVRSSPMEWKTRV